MSFGEACFLCSKPLPDVKGPELMDRQGRVYHLTCWCRMIDVAVQERRETIADRLDRLAAYKRKLANNDPEGLDKFSGGA